MRYAVAPWIPLTVYAAAPGCLAARVPMDEVNTGANAASGIRTADM